MIQVIQRLQRVDIHGARRDWSEDGRHFIIRWQRWRHGFSMPGKNTEEAEQDLNVYAMKKDGEKR